MEIKLGDSELKVMNVLWDEGDVTAKYVSERIAERYGWNINTTYTLLKRCVKKGAVERREPGFVCHALIKREQIQVQETEALLHKVFSGSVDNLFASLLTSKKLSDEEIKRLKRMVEELGGGGDDAH